MPGVHLELGPGTEKEGTTLRIRGSRVLAGRGAACAVRLVSDLASREHAALELANGVWVVRDLGSRNGTLLNGRPVDLEILRPGDQLAFGEDGAVVRVLQLAPPPSQGEDDLTRALVAERQSTGTDLPVLRPVAPAPPARAPARTTRPCFRTTVLPGLLALAGVAAIVLLSGLGGGEAVEEEALWSEARPGTPQELFDTVERALRERRLEHLWDVLGPDGRKGAEAVLRRPAVLQDLGLASLEDLERLGPRRACHRLGVAGGGEILLGHAWERLIRAQVDPGAGSGTLVVQDRTGAIEGRRIVLLDGVWRLER